jgi:oligopeptide/dipeptide ABC transporter ATP-binding protein
MKGLTRDFDTSIMLITHDLGVVAEMVDTVIVMYAGQVVEHTDVFTLFSSPKHPYTKGLLDSTPKIHERNEELLTIEGTVPTPAAMPKGCRFQPRCPYAMEKCVDEAPVLEETSAGHKVRCWLHEEGEVAI